VKFSSGDLSIDNINALDSIDKNNNYDEVLTTG